MNCIRISFEELKESDIIVASNRRLRKEVLEGKILYCKNYRSTPVHITFYFMEYPGEYLKINNINRFKLHQSLFPGDKIEEDRKIVKYKNGGVYYDVLIEYKGYTELREIPITLSAQKDLVHKDLGNLKYRRPGR